MRTRVKEKDLEHRAEELAKAAEARRLDWSSESSKLPSDDIVARIGLLASMLGIDPGTAFDPGVPVEEAVQASNKN